MTLRLLALAAAVATAMASCPNDCSNAGTCNQYSACECFRNFMGADCSQRQCTWAHSFIDVPQGDLNADGRTDVPNMYTVTLCRATSFFPQGYPGHYVTTNTDQSNTDAATTDGDSTSLRIVEGASATTGWNAAAGYNVLEDIYQADEYSITATTSNDPFGVVAHCLERDATLKYAIVVHVNAQEAPGALCDPNEWLDDDMDGGATRFERCVDIADAAKADKDLLRPASLFAYGNTGGDVDMTDVFVGMWSDMTYATQGTNSKTWEKYPANHGWALSGPASEAKNAWDEAHFYSECSSKGLCDRSSGLCQCFPGFEGDGCARTTCPDGCSGHGTCQRLVDIKDMYVAWDAYKTQKCSCDSGYTGNNCALRECPNGDDPVTRLVSANLQHHSTDGLDHTGHRTQSPEIQVIGVGAYTKLLTGLGTSGSATAPFALEFTDQYGDKWTTRSINFRKEGAQGYGGGTSDATKVAQSIEDALEALPNKVLTNVEVAAFTQTVPAFGCVATAADAVFCAVSSGGSGIPVEDGTYPMGPGAGFTIGAITSFGTAACVCTGTIPYADYAGGDFTASAAAAATNGDFSLTFKGGSLETITFCAGATISGCTADETATWAAHAYTNAASLYAITFVENAGDIPLLGARFNWGFNDGGDVTGDVADTDICAYSIITGANYDGETVGVNCITSKSTTSGGFDFPSEEFTFYAQELFKGDKENAVCSNRGICDYSTGLCKCFTGFTKDDCSVQNALSSF